MPIVLNPPPQLIIYIEALLILALTDLVHSFNGYMIFHLYDRPNNQGFCYRQCCIAPACTSTWPTFAEISVGSSFIKGCVFPHCS